MRLRRPEQPGARGAMRIVLDTNVIVSGLIAERGNPGRLLDAVRRGHVELVTAPIQVDEIADVLARPQIAERLTEGARDQLAHLFNDIAEVITDALPVVSTSADPDDNLILAIALAGHVDLIVSGDKKHMVNLGDIEGIPILSPASAIKRLEDRGAL